MNTAAMLFQKFWVKSAKMFEGQNSGSAYCGAAVLVEVFLFCGVPLLFSKSKTPKAVPSGF